MRVSIYRCLLCWVMMVTVPVSVLGQTGQAQTGQAPAGQTPAGQAPTEPAQPAQSQAPLAILHTQGGVWINGYEATDSAAVFAGDLLETKTGFVANMTLEGTTIQIQQESVAKLQPDVLVLDHGSVAVGTSKSFKVRVNCIIVEPVHSEWTQYDVTDVNGTVQVVAHKNDVRVEFGASRQQASKQEEASHDAVVHEGEQRKYEESAACGAPPRIPGGSSLSPKWIAAGGAAAGGVFLCVLLCGGSKSPVSPAKP